MRGSRIRMFALALCLSVCLAALAVPALAADETLDVTYVEISGDGFVADSWLVVDAVYNLNGPTLYCSDLIERFYAQVYGLTVTTSPGTPEVAQSGYWFELTDAPQPGDIAYASASSRASAHYAICREVDAANGTVMLFEQNWRWGNKAGVGRVIAYSGSPYVFYTLCGNQGELPAAPQPVQYESASVWAADAPSNWAVDSVLRASRYGISGSVVNSGYAQPITRGTFAKLAVNAAQAMGLTPESGDPYEAVRELGLMGGNASGDLCVDDFITREAAATVLVRFVRLFRAAPAADASALAGYADRAKISDWAAEAAALLTAEGIMGGTGSGFAPQENLSTEQALALLVRIYEYIW